MTGRITDAGTDAASGASHLVWRALVELEFASGTLYLATGLGNVDMGGHTYLGLGKLASISAIAENEALTANGLQLGLSGVDPALIATALTEHYQGRAARLYLALYDPATYALVGTAIGPFAGRMDTMDVSIGATATIVISVESRLRDWQRPRVRRYTDADQKAEYPADTAGEWVNRTVEQEIVF